jgi:acyl carrier protein
MAELTENEVLERLTAIFREVFEDDALTARPDMTAGDVERWDSLSHIDMIVLVEEAFRIRFASREIAGLKNVGELAGLIRARCR